MTMPDTKYSCISSSQLPWEVQPLIAWKFVLILSSGLSWKKFNLTPLICHSHPIFCNLKFFFWRSMPITSHLASIDYHELYALCSRNKDMHFFSLSPIPPAFLFLLPLSIFLSFSFPISLSQPHIQAHQFNYAFPCCFLCWEFHSSLIIAYTQLFLVNFLWR